MMKGFTLIEILVVMSMTMILTGFMVQNFSRARIDMNQTQLLVQNAIREAQSLALAGSKHGGVYRCGYGIHFAASGFTIYAGPNASTLDCASDGAHDRGYNAGTDTVVRSSTFPGGMQEFVLPAADIFFQPPDPVTYICTASPCGIAAQTAGVSTDIRVRRTGAACPSADCRTIHVTTSGVITAQ